MTELEKILRNTVDEGKTPSIQYALFNSDSIISQYSFGLADIAGSKSVDSRTTYNAYSVTKTFTALAVLQLADQGKIDIDKPVVHYWPEFPYSSEITTRQLLSHSAGIPNPIPLNWIHLASEHGSFSWNQYFKNIFLKNRKTKFLPNQAFAYSNLGYVLLGELIENLTNTSYEIYIRENIIHRLGLEDLDFEIRKPGFHAKGYHKRRSFTNLVLGYFIDKSKYMGKAEGGWKPFYPFYVNGIPYGGLIGTPSAFVKYIQELLKPRNCLLPAEYMKMMFSENYTSKNKATGMCLSWFTGKLNGAQYFTHAGGGGGYYCEIRIYPKEGIGSVCFFNRTGMTDERFLDRLDKFYL